MYFGCWESGCEGNDVGLEHANGNSADDVLSRVLRPIAGGDLDKAVRVPIVDGSHLLVVGDVDRCLVWRADGARNKSRCAQGPSEKTVP